VSFFFSSRRRHTRSKRDWSSDVCSSDLEIAKVYFTAFFERVFNNDKSFDDLFKNHQYGSDWLPDTAMVSRYEDAKYKTARAFNRSEERRVGKECMSGASTEQEDKKRAEG